MTTGRRAAPVGRRGPAGRQAVEPRARPGGSAGWRRALWLGLLLVALDLAVYAPALTYDFSDLDDPAYVVRNPSVAAGLTWRGIGWALTTGHAANWHPLTWLSHMVDVELFGMSPGPHHLTSVLLHVANTLLLFGLLRRMTGETGRSAVVAALFGVHPLHVESVAWVAERKDVLSTLFWLLTTWAYVDYVRRPALGRYLAVAGLFALGLMAKPMLVTLPFVLLLLDVWPLGRARPAGAAGPLLDPRAAGRLVVEKLPLLALTVVSSVVTFVAQERAGVVGGLDAYPLGQRAANAIVTYVAYLGKTLWPSGLAVLYPYPRVPAWQALAALLLVLGVTAVVLWAFRRAPYLTVGWLWYVGTLVPVIGLVQVGLQSMAADRYTYVPLVGVFIMAAWGLPDLVARWPRARAALPAAAAVAIAACALVAGRQVGFWKSSLALWTRAVEATRDNHIARNNLGLVVASEGRVDEAIALYTEALRIRPGYAEAHNNLGYALARMGRTDEALAHYAEALRLRPAFPEAHNNLGVALAAQGKTDAAIREFREAVRLRPDDAEAHVNVAVTLARAGDRAEAVRHFAEALRLNPAHAQAHYLLGLVLAEQGDAEQAGRHFEAAVRINPRFQKARQALAELMAARAREGRGGR